MDTNIPARLNILLVITVFHLMLVNTKVLKVCRHTIKVNMESEDKTNAIVLP